MISRNKELYNLLYFIYKNKKESLKVLYFYFRLTYSTIKKKISSSRKYNYPERAKIFKIDKIQLSQIPYYKNLFTKDHTLKTSLAKIEIKKNTSWIDINFETINDHETINSIHRWYWIVYDNDVLFNSNFYDILELVKTWIISFNNENDKIVWHPYNVSERISSLAIFLLNRLEEDEILDFIFQDKLLYDFLMKSINFLSSNLEYYPNGITYNHVINNLKGIVTGSILCNNKEKLFQSTSLIFKELDIILEGKGELREGSTHYQFIITRWICELEYILKKFRLNEIRNSLNNYTVNLIDNCLFYVVYDIEKNSYTIPLFGDISPDFDPHWIVNYFSELYPNNIKKSNISYGNHIFKYLNMCSFHLKNKTIGLLQNKFITRITFNEIDLFVSHPKSRTLFFPNHSHDDYSSFVLYINGKEIITDPGRFNYQKIDISSNQCHSSYHNVIEVNGHSVLLNEYNNYYFPSIYKNFDTSINNINKNDNYLILTLNSNSLNRIAECSISNYTRTFIISNKSIKLIDSIDGQGNINLVDNLSFSSDIYIHNNRKIIYLNSQELIEVDLNFEYDEISYLTSYNSIKYGQTCSGSQLKFSKKNASLPLQVSKTFKIK